MVFNKNKQGQAAIEFLMTYGWMLLVVLIVGALIFSFVDFGSLLPNKLDLSNNLRGSATESLAYSQGYSDSDIANEVVVVFTYTGAKQSQLSSGGHTIETTLGNICYSYNITNLDTGNTVGCETDQVYGDLPDGTGSCATDTTAQTTFLNGQTGLLRFQCDPVTGLIKGDVVEGDIVIKVKNPVTGLDVPSTGPIRLTIGQ